MVESCKFLDSFDGVCLKGTALVNGITYRPVLFTSILTVAGRMPSETSESVYPTPGPAFVKCGVADLLERQPRCTGYCEESNSEDIFDLIEQIQTQVDNLP